MIMVRFLMQACKNLNISITETTDTLKLEIPYKWQESLGGERLEVSKKEINEMHYLVQRIAKLVSDQRPTISYSKMFSELKGDKIYVWVKITLYKSMKEEIVKGYCYDVDSQRITSITYGDLSIFEKLEKRTPFLSNEALAIAYESVMDVAKKQAKQFTKLKQIEANEERNLEIERIENYYSLLAKEHANAETIELKEELTKKEEKEILQNEKEHLIEQQRIKHQIREEDIMIEPLAMLVMEIV